MKKNLLLAAAVTLALTACQTTQPSSSSSNASSTKSSGSASSSNSGSTSSSSSTGSSILGSIGSVAGAIGSSGSSSGSSSTDNKIGAGLDVLKAATITDDEIKQISLQYRQYEDKKQKVAAPGSKHGARLARLTKKHLKEDGLALNFKVYMSNNVNANATSDGSIRVYSGLMDMMTDAELLGVIGHEIGHVKHGHSLSRMRTAYLASAGRKAAAASAGGVGKLANTELGDLGEALVKGQFSQSQETESDDYGLAFMKKHKYDVKGMESAFRKIAKLGGSSSGLDQMTSSHPDAGKRADRMRDKANEK